ncbi:MAG: methyltransferase domain-containing protein [Chloroflexi bacterium]|nr:methyltransferase domain-containing protein [Chloroflexota bacterium]
MATVQEIPVEARLGALLDHLGVERAHFAGRTVGELEQLCIARPQAVSSLTLVNARLQRGLGVAGVEVLRAHADRLLAFFAHSPTPASELLREAISQMPGARLVAFPEGYEALGWHDVAAERTDELATTMREFILRAEQSHPATRLAFPATEGEVDEISYSIVGEGPALLLFPLSLARSQWAPLLPQLSEQFTTVVVGGRHLGLAAFLEVRAQLQGYQRVVRTMLAEVDLQPGERVLEVGCGTGALVRDLARRTGGANHITALDHNVYLLREAVALARAEGLDGAIDFREGDAEALSIEDQVYDVAFSSTVIREGYADRMMAEHVRVTRSGGRVAIAARALDLPHVLNLDVPDAVRRKVAAPRVGGGVAAAGCADASLYDRFARSGLTDIRMMPMWGPTSPPPDHWVDSCMHLLTPEEGEAFQAALRTGIEAGTAFGGPVYHVAVGTKP